MQNKESPGPELKTSPVEQLLINQAVSGSQEAFGKLYSMYYGQLVAYVYSYIKNFDIAEQLTQDTFYRAFAHIDRYVDNGYSFKPWLFKIAERLVINYHNRVVKRSSPTPVETILELFSLRGADIDEMPKNLVNREMLGILYKAINSLPKVQRSVVRLKLESGWNMSNLEIADELTQLEGKTFTEGAIKSAYKRALWKLKELLTGEPKTRKRK